MSTRHSDRGGRPNVLLILADDLGFSDLGCYGSEIETPNLDALAAGGVRMSQFYNTARCSPARASLLTGLHPHQTGIGILTHDDGPLGYPGTLNDRCVTMAEALGTGGYTSYLSGKWHLCGQVREPSPAWPLQRGFDHFYGMLIAAATYYHPATMWDQDQPVTEFAEDFYLTTALGRRAADTIDEHCRSQHGPFFSYLAFTAPHWPLHAPEDVVARYLDRYLAGWDELREQRCRRLAESGIVAGSTQLSDRDPDVPAWEETGDQAWQARRMAVYAAQVEIMDAEIGRVLNTLREHDQLDNTLIIFLSDNGGCAEEMPPGWMDDLRPMLHTPQSTPDGRRVRRGNAPDIDPGPADTYSSYGRPWANLSNTPFREYKHWVHEGGIATPLIAHWPAGLGAGGRIDHTPAQLPDIFATVLAATDVDYPDSFAGRDLLAPEGASMLPHWRGESGPDRTLFFEHEGNCAIRRGRHKLVRRYPTEPGREADGYDPWELYDLEADRTELNDLAAEQPGLVAELECAWQQWADRCGVKPRNQVITVTPRTEELTNHRYRSARPAQADR
jgi:arylsulfatase